MKINRIVCILALGAALMLPTSCKKGFLDPNDTKDPTGQSLFLVHDDAVKLVNGIYDTFDNNDFLIKALWYQANFLTQDADNWGSDTFFATYEIPVDNAALYTFWQRAYAGIARANSVFDVIPQMQTKGLISSDEAKSYLGQAYFLRGVFYYYLATNFGGVPLELKTVTDNGRHPRNTQDEVFTSVVNDMTQAAALLPWRFGDPAAGSEPVQAATEVGRATRGAAYNYMGDAQMWLKKYSDAVTTYKKLAGHYEMESDFGMIHDFNNQNGKEAIFSIQYIAGPDMNNPSNDTQWLTAFCMPWETTTMGYAYVAPNFATSFEAGDKRLKWTVIGPGQEHPDTKIQISKIPNVALPKNASFGGINTCGTVDKPWKGDDGLRSGYYNVKTWRDPNVNGRVGVTGQTAYQYSSLNMILMRYGGVLLSLAEAQSKSGDQGGADITLNSVRARAGLGAYTGDFTTALTSEYRHELGGEFSEFYYLRREGPGVASAFVKKYYGITIPNGHELMPIPLSAISSNSTLTQNPGY